MLRVEALPACDVEVGHFVDDELAKVFTEPLFVGDIEASLFGIDVTAELLHDRCAEFESFTCRKRFLDCPTLHGLFLPCFKGQRDSPAPIIIIAQNRRISQVSIITTNSPRAFPPVSNAVLSSSGRPTSTSSCILVNSRRSVTCPDSPNTPASSSINFMMR